MNGCTHFRCDSCNKIKNISEQNIAKTSYTQFNNMSENQLRYSVYHIQICNDCYTNKDDKCKK